MAKSAAFNTDPRVLKPIIEALIFASEEPLAPRLLVRLLAGERVETPGSEGSDPGADAETDEPENENSAGTDTSDDNAGPAMPIEALTVGWQEEEIGVESETAIPGFEADDILSRDSGDRAEDPVGSVELFPVRQKPVLNERYVRVMIEELNREYDETARAFRIVEVAGGFQFATVREYGEYVALLAKDKGRRRLSPAALETLSIIAYRQPVAKPEIESIRGVNCDQVLLSLLEKNLVLITGRSESVGRPLLYGTTEEFLRCFGLNSISDLPKLREIEELMEDDAYSAERIEVVTISQSSNAAEIEALVGAAGHHEEVGEEPRNRGTEGGVESRGVEESGSEGQMEGTEEPQGGEETEEESGEEGDSGEGAQYSGADSGAETGEPGTALDPVAGEQDTVVESATEEEDSGRMTHAERGA